MTLSERARDAVVDAGQLLMSGFEWWLLRSSQIPVTPFLDRADFAWAPALEAGWRDIRAELDQVLTQRDDLPNIQDIVADTVPISRDDRWKTFFFTAYGYRSETNRARCPATTALTDQFPGLGTRHGGSGGVGRPVRRAVPVTGTSCRDLHSRAAGSKRPAVARYLVPGTRTTSTRFLMTS